LEVGTSRRSETSKARTMEPIMEMGVEPAVEAKNVSALVAAWLRHVAADKWGTKPYL